MGTAKPKIAFVAYETPFAPCGGIAAVMDFLPERMAAESGLETLVISPLHFHSEKLCRLAFGGGFDCFEGLHRAQYFAPSEKYDTMLEHALRYGNAYQSQKAQAVNSLFGDSDEILIPEPKIPTCNEWSLIEKLNKEKSRLEKTIASLKKRLEMIEEKIQLAE